MPKEGLFEDKKQIIKWIIIKILFFIIIDKKYE